MRSTGKEYHAKYRAIYKTQGLCIQCGRKPELGFKRCSACREYRLNRPKDERKATRAKSKWKLKTEVLAAYGGNCQCCGEANPKFLTIDHINNNGNEHRKTVGSSSLYARLRKNGYPGGFQTMCFNCNSGRDKNRTICPHIEEPLVLSYC